MLSLQSDLSFRTNVLLVEKYRSGQIIKTISKSNVPTERNLF